MAVSRAELFPVPRSDPIDAYHEIGRDAGRMFKGAAPGDLPLQRPKPSN